ncbi:hypothetical protein [Sulfurovum sp.]|uniref:hypothetical protein n=1 Tax=Sulfurovum sp. TaxID=1969726 RepID=UPI0025E99BDB|nr:hypothetical protein [Sulfurovum sp.]
MNFKFDSATGFLITKAMEKLRANTVNQQVNINVTQEVGKDSRTPKNRRQTRAVPPRRKPTHRVAKPNAYNSYRYAPNAIDTGGRLFGGAMYGALGEIKSAISTPMNMAKSAIGKYRAKREQKQDDKHEIIVEKENKKQNDTLDDILTEVKKDRGGKGGFGFGGSVLGRTIVGGGIVGGLGLLLKKLFNPKTLLGRLGLPALIVSVISAASSEIKKVADTVGVNVDDLGIAGQMQGMVNMIGGKAVSAINTLLGALDISYRIDPGIIESITASVRESINTGIENLKDNYPKFGTAVDTLLSETNSVLGKATTWLSKASFVAMDAFRKKSDLEKEYIKNQDMVRNYDTFGSTLTGTSKEEYERAKAEKKRLAKTLVNQKDVKENSPYYKEMLKDIDPAENAKNVLLKKRIKVRKIEESIKKEANNLSSIKGEGWVTRKMKYTSEAQYKNEIETKEKQLEQHRKLLETAKEIVKEAEKTLKEAKSVNGENASSTSVSSTGASSQSSAGGPSSSANFNKNTKTVTYGDGTIKTGGHRNWRNNNPGNIITKGGFAKRHGAIGTDGRFAIFPSMEAGYNAQVALLRTKHYRNKTLSGAINRYAPRSENDTGAYIRSVVKRTGIAANTKMSSLSDKQLNSIVRAMAIHEGMKAGTVTYKSGGSANARTATIAKAKLNANQTNAAQNAKADQNKIDTTVREAATQVQNIDLAPVVNKLNEVVSAVQKTARTTTEKISKESPLIVVNIENKSTNRHIEGQV